MTSLIPTSEQLACIDAAARSDSLMISALAGTAKTTTLQMMAPQIRSPALALAFNRRIAEELKPRLPAHFTVKTLNGLGHSVWIRVLDRSVTNIKLDDRKQGKLITELARQARIQLSPDLWESARQLVSKAMQQGLVPADSGPEGLTPDSDVVWAGLCDDLGIEPDDAPMLTELARAVLRESITQAKLGVIGFDDQIYCPTLLLPDSAWPRFPVVFVDEAQDLSQLNHEMLRKATNPNSGRVCAVGDPKQSVYAFRGADANSMVNLRQLRPNWTDLPLLTTFRCPKKVVARQQTHAPGYRAHEANPDGVVDDVRAKAADELARGWSLGSLGVDSAELAVLCRNNAPILSLAFKLLRSGVGVRVLGRDIGKSLVALSRKIEPDDSAPRDCMAQKVSEWEERESSIARANDQPAKIESISDRAECLRATLTSAEARDAGQLRSLLERLFARERGQVTLSSIHRAKGLEWNTVLHLDPWRVPSRQSKRAAAAGDASALTQEHNLIYVAETRTRNRLILANLEDFEQ